MAKEKTFEDIYFTNSREYWCEDYKEIFLLYHESFYKNSIVREWTITDAVFNGNKVLLKWTKRLIPLTDDELKLKYPT